MAFPLILHEVQVKDLVENHAIHIDLHHPISVKKPWACYCKSSFRINPLILPCDQIAGPKPLLYRNYSAVIPYNGASRHEGEKKLRNAVCKPQTPGKATQPLSLLLLTHTMDWAIQVLSPAPTKALSMSYLHSPPTIPIRLSATSESDLLLMISKLI